jgi:hypothetical protein
MARKGSTSGVIEATIRVEFDFDGLDSMKDGLEEVTELIEKARQIGEAELMHFSVQGD